jgi:hypothetical protein
MPEPHMSAWGAREEVRCQTCLFYDDTTKTVSDEDDGTLLFLFLYGVPS